MKMTRRIITLLLALVLVLSMSATVFADDPTFTITIKNTTEGHTYQAYQILTGDLADGKLSNVTWGNGVNPSGLGDAATVAAGLKNSADADALAAQVAGKLTNPTATATVAAGATTCTLSNLPAGYYLIKTSATPNIDGVHTAYIMNISADTEIAVKAAVPSMEKSVNDGGDDVAIGETVTYTLTATMPSDIRGYTTYKMVFHDTMSAGLTFDKITSVKVGSKTLGASDYTKAQNGNELTITIANVIAHNATTETVIEVVYTATVNSNAVIGENGNTNTAYLEYSNDPYNTTSTGKTPNKEATVYTWSIPVFKYTGSENDKSPLPGAGFTLYTNEGCTTAVKLSGSGNTYKVDPNGTVTEITTDATGEFTIEGLAQGTYYLKETATPAGYNTCDIVTVTIGEDGALTADNAAVTEVEVLNLAGSTLPTTGGMGTTMIYVIGGILVLAAVVLLVTKRRMSTAE